MIRMPSWGRNALVLFVVFIVGVGIGGSGSGSEAPQAPRVVTVVETVAVDSSAEVDDDTTPPVTAPAEVDIETRCDYLLGGGGGSYRFVGGIDVDNVGERDVRVKAVGTWDRLGGSPVTQTKTFTVRSGEQRSVQLNVPASIDDISAHQSADARCRVRRKVTGL